MTTLLTIISDVAQELSLDSPASVIGSSDPTALRLLRMCNREGRDLAKSHDWTVLQRLHTFTTTATTEEYALPSDFSRLINDTEWDRTEARPIVGPMTPTQWQSIKSGTLGSGIYGRRYRVLRSSSNTTRKMRIDPVPSTTGDTLAFEYLSDAWCSSADGLTLQSEWAADTDVTLLDRDLLTLGTIVRYRRATGLDYASEADEYMTMFKREVSRDRPSPTLNLAQTSRLRLIGVDNLPETGIGL